MGDSVVGLGYILPGHHLLQGGERQEQECSHQYEPALPSRGPAWAPPDRLSPELAEVLALQETQTLAWLPHEPPDFSHEPRQLPLVLGRMENVSAPPKWKEASLSHLLSCVGRKGRARVAPILLCL